METSGGGAFVASRATNAGDRDGGGGGGEVVDGLCDGDSCVIVEIADIAIIK